MHVQPPSSSEEDDLSDLPHQIRGLGRLSISPSEPSGPTSRSRPGRSPASASAHASLSPRALGDPARGVAERQHSSAPFQAAAIRAEHWRSVENILTTIEHDSSVLVDRLASELHGDAANEGHTAESARTERLTTELRAAYAHAPLSPSLARPSSAQRSRSRSRSPRGGEQRSSPIAEVNTVLAELDREWSAAWDELGASAAGRYGAMAARMAELEAELRSLRLLAAHGQRVRDNVVNSGPFRVGRLSAARVLTAWRCEAARSARTRSRAEHTVLRRAAARMSSTRRRAWMALAGNAQSERTKRQPGRIAADQAARRIAQRLAWLAFGGWVGMVASRRKARNFAARIARRLEWRVLGAWRGVAQAQRAAAASATRLWARALRRDLAMGWDAWVEFGEARRSNRHLLTHAFLRLQHRELAHGFGGWAEIAAARARASRMLGRAARRILYRLEGAVFSAWAYFLVQSKAARELAGKMCRRALHREVGAAVRTWEVFAYQAALYRRAGAALVGRLKNLKAGRALATWEGNLADRQKRRAVRRAVLGRLRNRAHARAFDGWLFFVDERERNGRLLAKFGARLHHRRAWAAFLPWAELVAALRGARRAAVDMGERALRRLAHQLEARVFGALAAHVKEARRLRLLGRRVAARWCYRVQSSCLAGWRSVVSLRRHRREAVSLMALRRLSGNVAAVLRQWHGVVLSAHYGRRRWIAFLWRIVVSWRAYAHQRREARQQRSFHSELLHSGTRALLAGRVAAASANGRPSPGGLPGSLDAQLRREPKYASPPRTAKRDMAAMVELLLDSARGSGRRGGGAHEDDDEADEEEGGWSGGRPARAAALTFDDEDEEEDEDESSEDEGGAGSRLGARWPAQRTPALGTAAHAAQRGGTPTTAPSRAPSASREPRGASRSQARELSGSRQLEDDSDEDTGYGGSRPARFSLSLRAAATPAPTSRPSVAGTARSQGDSGGPVGARRLSHSSTETDNEEE